MSKPASVDASDVVISLHLMCGVSSFWIFPLFIKSLFGLIFLSSSALELVDGEIGSFFRE